MESRKGSELEPNRATLKGRMGTKDEPQPSPLWGASGSQEDTLSIIFLPQSAQLIPGKGKPWWLYLFQVKRYHQGTGRGARCQGESSAKAVAPQGATQHGTEPRSKEHQGFQKTPQNHPHHPPPPRSREGETPAHLEKPGKGRERATSKGKPVGLEGSAWWPSASASPLCQRGTKQARSGELPSARGS